MAKLTDEIKNKISGYITRCRVILASIITMAVGITTIAYRLPSPDQEKNIIKFESKQK